MPVIGRPKQRLAIGRVPFAADRAAAAKLPWTAKMATLIVRDGYLGSVGLGSRCRFCRRFCSLC